MSEVPFKTGSSGSSRRKVPGVDEGSMRGRHSVVMVCVILLCGVVAIVSARLGDTEKVASTFQKTVFANRADGQDTPIETNELAADSKRRSTVSRFEQRRSNSSIRSEQVDDGAIRARWLDASMARFADLAVYWASERPDPEWSQNVSGYFYGMLEDNELDLEVLAGVDCRESLCRLELKPNDMNVLNRLQTRAVEDGYPFVQALSDGGGSVFVLIPREGLENAMLVTIGRNAPTPAFAQP